MAKTILVPYDSSDNAKKALKWAVDFAKLTGLRLQVMNIQPSFRTVHAKAFFNRGDVEEYQTQLFKEATEGVDTMLNETGVPYELSMGAGDPKECLIDFVLQSKTTENPVELIVMGSRGTNPFFGGVLGSVSYAMINAGVCPVTIIPQMKEHDQ
ncbi:MAG: universal stress protein [Pelistega sp.]|nr:universal stress protein [Pelistega sp.]